MEIEGEGESLPSLFSPFLPAKKMGKSRLLAVNTSRHGMFPKKIIHAFIIFLFIYLAKRLFLPPFILLVGPREGGGWLLLSCHDGRKEALSPFFVGEMIVWMKMAFPGAAAEGLKKVERGPPQPLSSPFHICTVAKWEKIRLPPGEREERN